MTRPKKQELLERYGDWQTGAFERHKEELTAPGVGLLDIESLRRKPETEVERKRRLRRCAVKLWRRVHDLPFIPAKRGLKAVVQGMDDRIRDDLLVFIRGLRVFLTKLENELKASKKQEV